MVGSKLVTFDLTLRAICTSSIQTIYLERLELATSEYLDHDSVSRSWV